MSGCWWACSCSPGTSPPTADAPMTRLSEPTSTPRPRRGRCSRSRCCRRCSCCPPARAPDRRAPAVIGRRVIGHSVQGRPIVAWHLGEPGKPKVVLISLMHGNEPAPRRILTDLRDGAAGARPEPLGGAGLQPRRAGPPHPQERPRRRPQPQLPLQVGAARPATTTPGPKPASEPETRAMMRFLARVKPAYVLSFHQPLHGVDITAAPGVLPPGRAGARPADDAA